MEEDKLVLFIIRYKNPYGLESKTGRNYEEVLEYAEQKAKKKGCEVAVVA